MNGERCVGLRRAHHGTVRETHPTRSLPRRSEFIALSSPASGPDIIGRLIGQKFTEAWGQQVIVDTRPGASGIIGVPLKGVLRGIHRRLIGFRFLRPLPVFNQLIDKEDNECPE